MNKVITLDAHAIYNFINIFLKNQKTDASQNLYKELIEINNKCKLSGEYNTQGDLRIIYQIDNQSPVHLNYSVDSSEAAYFERQLFYREGRID